MLKFAIEFNTDPLFISDMSVSLRACFGLLDVEGGVGGPPLDGPFTTLLLTLLLFDCPGLNAPGGRRGAEPGAVRQIKSL